MDKLSICIPTYKRLDYLKAFVETVPEKYQVCISDNGNFIPDDFFKRGNVKIKHLEDVIPMFANWNSAIEMVETKWFIIPGDDDIVKANMLPVIEECIEKYNDCAYLAFGYDVIDENSKVTGGWLPEKTGKINPVDAFMLIKRNVPFRWPSIVINAYRSRSVGNFDEEFVFTAADSLYLQIMAMKYPIALIAANIGQYRVWKNSFTNKLIFSKEWFDYIELWQQKLKKIIKEERIEGINTNLLHDQAVLDNQIVALSLNKQATLKEKIKFVYQTGWPIRCEIRNQLRLLRSIMS